MKNAFYFVLKALFILKIFKFCPDFLGHAGTRLDKKTKVNFKIYAIINWEKIITIYILSNISRNNQGNLKIIRQ